MLKIDKIVRSDISLLLPTEDEFYFYLIPVLNQVNFEAINFPPELKKLYVSLKLEIYINEFLNNRTYLQTNQSNFLEVVENVFSKLSLSYTPLIDNVNGASVFKIALSYIDNLFYGLDPQSFYQFMDTEFKEIFLSRLLQSELSFIYSSEFCLNFFSHVQGKQFFSDELNSYTNFFNNDGFLNYRSILRSRKSLEIFLIMTVSASYKFNVDKDFLLFLKFLKDARSPFIDFTDFSILQKKYENLMRNYNLDNVVEFVLAYAPQLMIIGNEDDYIFYILHDSFMIGINDHVRYRNNTFIQNWFQVLLLHSGLTDDLSQKIFSLLNDKVLKNSSLVQSVFLLVIQSFEDPFLLNILKTSLSSSDMLSNRGVYRVCKFLNKLFYLFNASKIDEFKSLDFSTFGLNFSIDTLDSFFDSMICHRVIKDFNVSDSEIIDRFYSIRSQLLHLYCFYNFPNLTSHHDLISDGFINSVLEFESQRNIDTPLTDSLPSQLLDTFLVNTTFQACDGMTIFESDNFLEILRMGVEPKVTCYSALDGTFRENLLPVLFLKDRKYLRLLRNTSFYARAVVRFITFDFKLSANPRHCDVAGLTIDNFSGKASDLQYFMSFLCFKSLKCGVHLVVHSSFFIYLRPFLDQYNFNSVDPVVVDHKPQNIFDLHYTDNASCSNGDFMAVYLNSKK